MEGQISLFDFLQKEFKPGDWIEECYIGNGLTFDEITGLIGELIVLDMSTESHKWYKIVQVEKITAGDNGNRRLIYYDGKRQRGLVDEMYFDPQMPNPDKAYAIKSID